ncbi:MAG: PIG-L family deacetylase [Cytophagaceae bacterium]
MNFLRVFTAFLFLSHLSIAQPVSQPNASEIQHALKKLTHTGSVLYVAAHPDDENTSLIAYMSNELMARTGYLSLTRGDGGQNLIGKEQGELLGLIRTQELLEARKRDGGEQFFTRAYDFGYSKSAEESFEIWGKDTILADVVWVIRKFRPDVIITRFPSFDAYGHGHHTASALLAQLAFTAAADPTMFPEQLDYVQPWQAKRLLYNSSRWWKQGLEEYYTETGKNHIRVDVGKYNGLLGNSYTEIAAESRSQHKSQGFGTTPKRGEFIEFLELTSGAPMEKGIFDGIDVSWNRVEGARGANKLLQKAYKEFDTRNPEKSLPVLVKAYRELQKLKGNPLVDYKLGELKEIIRTCSGVWMQAFTNRYYVSPGDELEIQAGLVNRSGSKVKLERIKQAGRDTSLNLVTESNKLHSFLLSVSLPEDAEFSQPFWLVQERMNGLFDIPELPMRGLPESSPSMETIFDLEIEGLKLSYTVPVLFQWNDPVDGERFRPVEITPSVVLNISEPSYIFGSDKGQEVTIRARALRQMQTGIVSLALPEGWRSEPESVGLSIENKGDERLLSFMVFPPKGNSEGSFTAEFRNSKGLANRSMVSLEYPHITTQTLFPKANARLVRMDIKRNDERIGYIMGAGDKVPEMLRNIGYQVKMIDQNILVGGDLSAYDVIITGVRAYNTNSDLQHFNKILLKFVEDGGTLLVQYNVSRGLVTEDIGPYPFSITRERVTDEASPVEFVNTIHPILHLPNRITENDFKGWVQERGLYFVGEKAEEYESILAFQDPGEEMNEGSLIVADYGKGKFIYSGISFFRQLPAGVPGAYKLFINMISYGKK